MTRWFLAVMFAGCVEGGGDNPAGRGVDNAPAAGVAEGSADGGGAQAGLGAGAAGQAGGAGDPVGAPDGEIGGGTGDVSGAGEGGSGGDAGDQGTDGDEADDGPADGAGEGGADGAEGQDGGEGSEAEGGQEAGEGGQAGQDGEDGQQGEGGQEGEGAEGGDPGGVECEPVGDRELCGTGLDEDCDGAVDEGFDIDDPCEAGRGGCHRVGEWVCTVDGRGLFCGVEAGAPVAEVCGNEIDDDCDGGIDERFVVGQDCEAGVGDCRALGQWECSADGRGVVCSAQRGDGRLELCGDGSDNDCDGVVDEAAWVGDDCGVGAGVCHRQGAWECGADGRSVCSAGPGAPEEPDGEVTCDGADNDCDGVTDEFPAGGGPCEAGRGVCHREGVLVCQADGAEICSIRAGDPQEAVEAQCDSLDNDCDGQVDEGMGLGAPCQGGAGACRVQGVTACNGQGAVGCSVRPPEAPEPGIERTCDGVDGDCDGEIDEGCDDDGDDRCDAAMAVVGRPAACPDTPPGQGDDCDDESANRRPGLRDSCDGVDQDCDGEVDESGDQGGQPCVPPYVGALAKSQGRWGYGGEVGVEGARSSCRVLAGHSDLCSRDQLVMASEASDLAGAVGEDGQAITSLWVDVAEGARCERDVPWSENDPESAARGHVIFINNGSGLVVSERDTLCSVPRHVACCGWE